MSNTKKKSIKSNKKTDTKKHYNKKTKKNSNKPSNEFNITKTNKSTITHKYNNEPSELKHHKQKSSTIAKITNCAEKQYLYYKKYTIPNTKKYYKDIDSNAQIKAVINYGNKYNTTYINKLMGLFMKHFAPYNYDYIYKLITSSKSDASIFKSLRKLKRWYPQEYGFTCNKNLLISQQIAKYNKAQNVTINNYLDIGCGNCKFTKTLGKELGLNPDQIYGIDPDNYAEQDDWGRDTTGMIFNRVLPNEVFPFEDNKFDYITMNMVLHHVKDIDFLMTETYRVLKKDGILFITDHDAFAYIDKMLVDIEHQLYTEVLYYNSKTEKVKYSVKQGYLHYFNWLEFDIIIEKHGFKWIKGDLINLSVRAADLNPTRTFYGIYKKV